MSKSKTEMVVKSNRLIEASYRLGLVEQQIILFAICRSREEQKGLTANTPVTISANDFVAQFGTNAAMVYQQLKHAVSTLYERSVTIHDIDPVSNKVRSTETRWISDKSYIDGTGQIQLTFASKVIPFITRLDKEGGFTSYRLEKIGAMSSAHAVRLYELLVQYLSIGTRKIDIVWLKERLQLGDDYPRMFDFKKRVLDVAMKQINDHSDIAVSYTQCKTGRIVSHLIFTIELKSEEKPAKTKKAPARIALPDSVTMPVVKNRDNPAVKDARSQALAMVRKGKLGGEIKQSGS